MSSSRLPYLLATALLAAGLAACSDEPDAKKAAAPAASPATKPAPAAPTPAPAPVGMAYDATLAQGIDFTRAGYPRFLKEVQGVSGEESWGRWTDANLSPTARLRFASPLPKTFTLELRASGLGPNA